MTDLKIAKHRYAVQKAGAKARNVEWQLTFEEWNSWWIKNGIDKNISNSSLGPDQPCMCRNNDTGPYSLDNIYLASRKQNSIDSRQNKKYISPPPKKSINTPAGFFQSRKEAAEYFGVAEVTVSSWVKKYPNEYRYEVLGK